MLSDLSLTITLIFWANFLFQKMLVPVKYLYDLPVWKKKIKWKSTSHFRDTLKDCCVWIGCRAACLVSLVPAVYNDENQVQRPAKEVCCERTAWRKREFLLCVSRGHSLLGTGTLAGIFARFAASSCPTAAREQRWVGARYQPPGWGPQQLSPRAAHPALSLTRSSSRLRTSLSSCSTKRKQSGNCDLQVCLWVTASLGASFIALQLAHQFRLRSVWSEKVLARHASDVLVLLSMISLHSLQRFPLPFGLFHLKHISATQPLKLCLCKISDCKTLERSLGIQPVVEYSWHLTCESTTLFFSLLPLGSGSHGSKSFVICKMTIILQPPYCEA